MIKITNVTKQFYSLTAIDNLSLRLPQGEVLGILGPNGAGKTTLLKLIAGILHPTSGSIQPISGNWPRIGYKPERLLFPNHLTITRYLELVALVSNVPTNRVARSIRHSLQQTGLETMAHRKIKECSKGMRQRLAMAQALIGNPDLLLLDEPSSGLDPHGQAEINQLIRNLHQSGKTILISSHRLREITEVCTYLVILNHGRILYENSMASALAARAQTIIETDKDLSPIQDALLTLHEDIQIDGNKLYLRNEAMRLRRQALVMLLHAGYDVTHVEQRRKTLAEIYAEAVQ